MDEQPDIVFVTEPYFAEYTIIDPCTDAVQAIGRFRNGTSLAIHAEPYEPQPETYPAPSVFDNLKIRNIRFIDDNRDHVITSGESSKVIFEIMNEGDRTVYNVVPIVTETTGMKRIYISPSVMVEQIAPHNGVKYTANISAGERIKTGNITIRVAVANGNGQQYDRQEFSLPTER